MYVMRYKCLIAICLLLAARASVAIISRCVATTICHRFSVSGDSTMTSGDVPIMAAERVDL